MVDVDEAAVVRLFIEGRLTGPEVAAHLGIGTTTVYRILHRNGVDAQRRRWSLYYESLGCEPQDVVDAYLAGDSIATIATRQGLNNLTVRNVLMRHGVQRRRVGGRNRPLTEEEVERAVALRRQGMPLDDIAGEMHRGIKHVRDALAALGIAGRLPPRRAPRVSSQGYVSVWIEPNDAMRPMAFKNGYVNEHRLVMARHLRRLLSNDETVHHINGDKADNRIENLQLRQGRHGKHAAFQCADCGSHNVVATKLL